MAMNNMQITISFSVSFAEIPPGMEDDAELIIANIETLANSRIQSLLSDNIEALNNDAIQSELESIAYYECASASSSSQTENAKNGYGTLSDGIIVSVSVSSTAEDIINYVEEEIVSQMQSALGGG